MINSVFNLFGCSVCMGIGAEHRDSVAVGWAMLVMLVIIIPMLTAIIFFISRMAKRERENMDPSLSD